MISIRTATEKDYASIVEIGTIAVADAHGASTTAENMNEYLDRNYNEQAIREELIDPKNVYHLICNKEVPVGFSKIIFNAKNPAIPAGNVTKLDRIYILKEFYGLKLGWELLNFNIGLSREQGQSGIWLYTWVGNKRAIDFYHKAGFTIIGRHEFYVTATHYNLNHLMFLEL